MKRSLLISTTPRTILVPISGCRIRRQKDINVGYALTRRSLQSDEITVSDGSSFGTSSSRLVITVDADSGGGDAIELQISPSVLCFIHQVSAVVSRAVSDTITSSLTVRDKNGNIISTIDMTDDAVSGAGPFVTEHHSTLGTLSDAVLMHEDARLFLTFTPSTEIWTDGDTITLDLVTFFESLTDCGLMSIEGRNVDLKFREDDYAFIDRDDAAELTVSMSASTAYLIMEE